MNPTATPAARPVLTASAVHALAALAIALLALALVPARAPAAAPPQFVGLQSFLTGAGPLDRVRSARVTEFRAMVNWGRLEPTEPSCTGSPSCHRYEWRGTDALFDLAARRNIRVLPYLLGSPSWANPADHKWPPSNALGRRAFKDYVAAFTRRYGPNGTFWVGKEGYATSAVRPRYLQIWNEPNLGNYWNASPSPGQYASLLSTASDTAKAADPDIRIVSAGIPWGKGMSPETFLRGMYAWNGGAVARKVDAIAIHVYKQYPYQIPPALSSIRSTLRGISRSAGSRPIWITEMGWATGPYDGRYQVGEDRQASNLREAYGRILGLRDRYEIDRAFWFNLVDVPKGRGWWFHTGLFDRYGRAKPSWSAFRRVTGAAG